MNQIGLKFTADVRQAQTSLRSLERDMKKIRTIDNRGKGNNNNISKRDAENYKDLQRDFARNYSSYVNSMISNARRLKTEQRRLIDEINRAQTDKARKTYEEQLKKLMAQKRMMEMNIAQAKYYNGQQNQSGQSIAGMTPMSSQAMQQQRQSMSLMGMAAAFKVMQRTAAFATSSYGDSRNLDEAVYRMATRMNTGYKGNSGVFSEKAIKAGMSYGYSGLDTANTAGQYTSIAGIKSFGKAMTDVRSMQQFSRAYGMNPSDLADTSGDLVRMGASSEGQQRKFARILANSIKQSGMNGRENEMIKATHDLASSLYESKLKVTQGDLVNAMSLQTALAQASPQMKGQRGADMISRMNSSIVGSSDKLDLLMGWGTTYQGTKGKWALELQQSKGVADPKNLATILGNARKYAGKDEFLERQILKENLNLKPEEVELLMKDRDKSGSLYSQFLSGHGNVQALKDQAAGKSNIGNKVKNYNKDTLSTENKTTANTANVKYHAGKVERSALEPILKMYNSLPVGLQAATNIVGGSVGIWGAQKAGKGVMKYAPKAGSALANLFKSGGTRAASGLAQNGGTLIGTAGEALSKIALPLSVAFAVNERSKYGMQTAKSEYSDLEQSVFHKFPKYKGIKLPKGYHWSLNGNISENLTAGHKGEQKSWTVEQFAKKHHLEGYSETKKESDNIKKRDQQIKSQREVLYLEQQVVDGRIIAIRSERDLISKKGVTTLSSNTTNAGSSYINQNLPPELRSALLQLNANGVATTTSSKELKPITKSTYSGSKASGMVKVANDLLGVPYVWGGEDPAKEGGVDCSGLVDYAAKMVGAKLNGRLTADDLYHLCTKIGKGDLQPGDLGFLKDKDNPNVMGHVGIYEGKNVWIHASSSKGQVVKSHNMSWHAYGRLPFATEHAKKPKVNLSGVTTGSSSSPVVDLGGSNWSNVDQWDSLIQKAAAKYGVDPNIIKAIIKQESGGNSQLTGGSGEYGLMQIMPNTWKGLGGKGNPYDPQNNINTGTRYFAQLLNKYGDVTKAVSAYNQGEGNLAKNGISNTGYVNGVIGNYAELTKAKSSSSNNYQATAPGNTAPASNNSSSTSSKGKTKSKSKSKSKSSSTSSKGSSAKNNATSLNINVKFSGGVNGVSRGAEAGMMSAFKSSLHVNNIMAFVQDATKRQNS